MQEEKRREDLPLHPPGQPYSVFGCPALGRLTIKQTQKIITPDGQLRFRGVTEEACNVRYKVKLGVNRIKYDDVEVMAEIGPDEDEDSEADVLGVFELEVVQDFAEGEADVREIHRQVDGVSDVCHIDEVAPPGGGK